jgi:hypothetical protein
MWDHANDPGHTQIARVLHRDLQLLKDLDLNGFNSCQVQRVSFPTSLPMTIMGWTLWNNGREFDQMADDYFDHAYGPAGRQVRAYLERLTDLFDPTYLRGEKTDQSAQAAGKLRQVPAMLAQFKPAIDRHIASTANPCWRESWLLLRVYAELVGLLAAALEARALGDSVDARRRWDAVKAFIRANQSELDATFDDWLFIQVYDGKFADAPQSH